MMSSPIIQAGNRKPLENAGAEPSRKSYPTLLHIVTPLLLHAVNDIRNRTDPAYLDFFHNQLVPDVRERGVQVPLIGHREGERIRVIDGQTRLNAALLAGCQKVPVLVYDRKPSDAEITLGQVLANSMRRDLTPLEYSAVYQQLLTDNGWSQRELARRLHVSAAHVAKCLAISNKLCPELQALVASGELPPRAAYTLSRVEPAQQMELAEKFRNDLLCVEGLESRVGELLGKRGKKAKPWTLKDRNIALSIKGDLAEGIELLMSKLREILKRLKADPGPA